MPQQRPPNYNIEANERLRRDMQRYMNDLYTRNVDYYLADLQNGEAMPQFPDPEIIRRIEVLTTLLNNPVHTPYTTTTATNTTSTNYYGGEMKVKKTPPPIEPQDDLAREFEAKCKAEEEARGERLPQRLLRLGLPRFDARGEPRIRPEEAPINGQWVGPDTAFVLVDAAAAGDPPF